MNLIWREKKSNSTSTVGIFVISKLFDASGISFLSSLPAIVDSVSHREEEARLLDPPLGLTLATTYPLLLLVPLLVVTVVRGDAAFEDERFKLETFCETLNKSKLFGDTCELDKELSLVVTTKLVVTLDTCGIMLPMVTVDGDNVEFNVHIGCNVGDDGGGGG